MGTYYLGVVSINTVEFLNTLYGDIDEPYYITIWNKQTKLTNWLPIQDLINIDISQAKHDDIYFGIALGSAIQPKRLSIENTAGIPGLWIDFDLKDETHPNNPNDIQEILTFIDSLPHEPSICVATGHGVHAYWLCREFFSFDNNEDRILAQSIVKGWQSFIRSRATFKIDTTHDLARVLRLPGTQNFKSEPPMPVEVISHSDIRYNLSDFANYAVEVSQATRKDKFKRNPSDKPAEVSISQCAFLRACRDYPAELPEPVWTAALCNISRCSDGPTMCHEISKGYPKYTYKETEAKIFHVLNDMHPTTCKYIHDTLKFKCPEGGCGVKSPCGFSLMKSNDDNILDEPIPSGFFEGEELPGIEKLTDLGNAERFAKMFKGQLLYCNQMGKWLIWNGKIWRADDTLEIYQYAKKCVRSMHVLVATIDDAELRKSISKFANSSESLKNINSMLSLARGELPVTMEQLDGDKWIINADNGVINLKTGELRQHVSSDYNTKIVNAEYNPNNEAPIFTEFINSVFNGDQELIEFMQRFLGYCLTGDTREQQFVIAHGSGSNGKGTLLNLILDIMGNYAITTPTDTICKKNTEKISNDIARLSGARFVLMSETERGKRFDEALVKKMTGQDRMSARFLYKEDFEFMPQFKLCLMTNDKPQARADDAALWRRIQLVPFSQKFEGAQADCELSEKLRTPEERAGILNWMVQGCLAWQRERLNPPESVLQATNEYRSESDKFQMWVEDCCIIENSAVASSDELYQSYKNWNLDNGEKFIPSKISFTKDLVKKGFLGFRGTGGIRKYRGIGIVEEHQSCGSEQIF